MNPLYEKTYPSDRAKVLQSHLRLNGSYDTPSPMGKLTGNWSLLSHQKCKELIDKAKELCDVDEELEDVETTPSFTE